MSQELTGGPRGECGIQGIGLYNTVGELPFSEKPDALMTASGSGISTALKTPAHTGQKNSAEMWVSCPAADWKTQISEEVSSGFESA